MEAAREHLKEIRDRVRSVTPGTDRLHVQFTNGHSLTIVQRSAGYVCAMNRRVDELGNPHPGSETEAVEADLIPIIDMVANETPRA